MNQPARRQIPSDSTQPGASHSGVIFPEVARPAPRADGRALAQRLENKYLARITGVPVGTSVSDMGTARPTRSSVARTPGPVMLRHSG